MSAERFPADQALGELLHAGEQAEPVRPDGRVVGHHEHRVEERVDRCDQRGADRGELRQI